MRNALLVLMIALPITACGSLGIANDPATGEPAVVNTSTGEVVVPIVETVETVGNMAGALVGIPSLGLLLGGLATVFLTKRAKKPAVT